MPRTFYRAPAAVKAAVLHDLRTTQHRYKDIAERHGVSTSAVGKWAEAIGIRKALRGYEINWRPVRCLYEDGHTQVDIARKTGIPVRTIGRWLVSQGFHTKRTYAKTDIHLLVKLRERNRLTWRQIAEHVNNGIDHGTIRRQYLAWKLRHNQTPVRSVGKNGRRKKCPHATNSPRSKPMPSYKTSATTSPTASSPNATASARP